MSSEKIPGLVVEAVGAEHLEETVEVVSLRFRRSLLYAVHVFCFGHHRRRWRSVGHANVPVIVNPRKFVVTALSSQKVFMRFVNLVNERFYFVVAVAVAVAVVFAVALVVRNKCASGHCVGV